MVQRGVWVVCAVSEGACEVGYEVPQRCAVEGECCGEREELCIEEMQRFVPVCAQRDDENVVCEHMRLERVFPDKLASRDRERGGKSGGVLGDAIDARQPLL